MIRACPTAEVSAPIDEIWSLLSDPMQLDTWWDARTTRVDPPGPIAAGQRLLAQSGPGLRIQMEVVEVDAPRKLLLLVELPLGIRANVAIYCAAIDSARTRASYG